MASINQLVSEIAHIAQDPNNIALRRSIRQEIIYTRNELIRKSFNSHGSSDKVHQQRFKVTLVDVPDGDLFGTSNLKLPIIKRTAQKVPRPVRLNNNLPFHSIRTSGFNHPISIPFVKEAVSIFYGCIPGMCNMCTYDYINGYVYVNVIDKDPYNSLQSIIIESIFEHPHLINAETVDNNDPVDPTTIDDDEFLLSEDLIGAVKDLVLARLHLEIPRETNETTMFHKVNG